MLQQVDARAAHLEKIEAEVDQWQKERAKSSEADLKGRAAERRRAFTRRISDKAIVAAVNDADGKMLQALSTR